MIEKKTSRLRALLQAKTFLHMPAVYDAQGARLVEQAGFEAVYCGGFVSGAARAVSEPLLTMTEQITLASDAAAAVKIPMVVDAGAGFGEPLHTMRTVREFIRAGISGVHIEDQLFPKRAHYHVYQVHEVTPEEFGVKIGYACRERDRSDPDFVIIARSDSMLRRIASTAVPMPERISACCSRATSRRPNGRRAFAACRWFM